jgi:hypothetical protein
MLKLGVFIIDIWRGGVVKHVSVKMDYLQIMKISKSTEKRHAVMGKPPPPHMVIIKTP